MKIVSFQYNKLASAIIQEHTLDREEKGPDKQITGNCFLAGGYSDRFLWEEAASLRPRQRAEYAIVGNWQ